jgi:hypothetical protein
MKRLIRSCFLFLMLAVFLCMTTGVSFYIHECRSSHTREILAFQEITNQKTACCCDDAVNGNILSGESSPGISEPECCINSHIYLKLSFTGFPLFYQFNPDLLQKDMSVGQLNTLSEDEKAEIDISPPRIDHPPPRSGKVLIEFLHQIKIPAAIS